ncbi:MAG TPA: 3-phosphoshikimate 1-carboxyvinyltransferase [Feifaniaceae bacterium]|nr:3-phosphoshikimate 1-carboxyvinyltransferase [Feifaniaceae bacterium]
MNLCISPSSLGGELAAIPSKSDAHRVLILAALSNGTTRVEISRLSDDIQTTIDCLSALGAEIRRTPDALIVRGITDFSERSELNCRESGSTLRFLLPVAAVRGANARFTGSGRLPERPIGELMEAMRRHGVRFSAEQLPFSMEGKLSGGTYALPGNVSSQYLTGLLLALPLAKQDSSIRLTTKLESAAYVEMTLRSLRAFWAVIDEQDGTYRIPGSQVYRSPDLISVEGDWSNAAFFLAAGALGGRVRLTGLSSESPQGDQGILAALSAFGAQVTQSGGAVEVSARPLHGCELDVSETPDLLPILAVLAANAEGETRLVNAARLRYKESDRLSATANLVNALGGTAGELPDGLVVSGGRLTGGTVDGCRDHRIVMAAAIASVACREPVTILGADAVNKSYPEFFEDFARLGGTWHVV